LVLTIVALGIFLIAYTFGAGIFFLLPGSALLFICRVFVSYYTETRRSYYLNYDTVLHPPVDLAEEVQNRTIPEEELQAREEELRKEREEIEKSHR
jgi:hypothetical protein